MASLKELYYEKRGKILVNNLKKRHFDAYYFSNGAEALEKILSMIDKDALVGWGGAMSAHQIGLFDELRNGSYRIIDRDACKSQEARTQAARECLHTDIFVTGANAISLDGQMVNIDGMGNRVAAIVYGPKEIFVIAGMNKVVDNLDDAVRRARTVAAPLNQQRFCTDNPCTQTGTCADCKSETCICNHILITRHCRPVGRIKFFIIGEELGL